MTYSGTLIQDLTKTVALAELRYESFLRGDPFALWLPCWSDWKPFFPGFLGTCDYQGPDFECNQLAVVYDLKSEQELCLRHFWRVSLLNELEGLK